MQDEIESLHSQVASLTNPIGKFKEYKNNNVFRNMSLKADCTDTQYADYKAKYELDLAASVENEAIAQFNKDLIDRIIAMICLTGIPGSVYRYKSTRSYNKVRVEADWKSDLLAAVPTAPTTRKQVEDWWVSFNKQRDGYIKSQEDAKRFAEETAKQETRRRAELVLVITIANELGLDATQHNAESLVEYLRSQDQYLDLAIAMADTRGDWSDGFYRVRSALDRFTCKTKTDQEMYNDIEGCMDSDDGRVFRDTEWNYDELFGRVEPKIFKYYNQLREYR